MVENVPRSQRQRADRRIFVIEVLHFKLLPLHPSRTAGRAVMAKTTKRKLEDAGEGTSPKKIKLASKPEKKRKSGAAEVPAQTSSGPNGEVNFPRGGGTSFTPAEVKSIRAEAQREANEDIFKVRVGCGFCVTSARLRCFLTGNQSVED